MRRLLIALLLLPLVAHAAERITLRNGFSMDCVRREVEGDRVRLYTNPQSYLEIASAQIESVEQIPDPPAAPAPRQTQSAAPLNQSEIHQMLTTAGAAHRIDADLLAAVVRAESNFQIRAVSRTGARGLMQLMPGTAGDLGVKDAFEPAQNIAGGSAYLDTLLSRYHDNIALALAAYNAGPAAVDRYHGIPPFRETRAYVARVIREFNRRKKTPTAGALAAN